MKHTIEEIKENIRIAKAIDEDISAFSTYDVHAAYQKNRKIVSISHKKQSLVRLALRIAAILLLPLLVSTSVLTYLYMDQLRFGKQTSYLEVISAPGTVTRVELPDKSKVCLNAGSTLRYPSRFTGDDREVFLNGEGYFEVQSDKEHPFYVSVGNGIQVKAHGTKFNVNAYSDDPWMEAALESGRIDVLINKLPVQLKPNEQACFNKIEKKVSVASINIDEKISWKDGRLIFRNATLEEVVKQLSRRYNMDIVLHKESKKDYKFRASFTTENITQILNYLRLAAPIEWAIADVKQQQDLSYSRQRIDVWLK